MITSKHVIALTEEIAKLQTLLNKALDDYGRVQVELIASRDQWRTMACTDCAMVASLKAELDALTADRDRLAQEVRDVNQRLGEAWEKLREMEGKANQ